MKKNFVIISNDTNQFLSHRIHLIKILKNLNFNIFILCPKNDKVFEKLNVNFINFDIGRKKKFFLFEIFSLIKLFFILKNLKPDVIQSIAIKPSLYSLVCGKILNNTKCIINITGLGYIFNNKNSFLLQKIIIGIFKTFKQEKNVFIFQNKFEKNFFIKNRICKEFQSKLVEGSPIKKIFKKRNIDKKKNIICVSRMLYDKGIVDFIDCSKRIIDKNYDFNFFLIGSIDEENKSSIKKNHLTKLIENNKKIKWLGYQPNLEKIFDEAIVMCFPSYHEGSPRVLIEAISRGLPIIAYNIPGCRTIVKNNFNGYLVKKKNINLLTSRLVKLLENKKKLKRFSLNSNLMANKFLLTNMNTIYKNIYKKI